MSSLSFFTRAGDKVGALGAVISATGCAMCFPAIASLGGALGLSFLSQWEWTFINTLLPTFAGFIIVINALGYFSHRQWLRSGIAMVGPLLLLLSLYPLFQYAWSTYVTYSALALIVMVSIGDMVYPANKHCDDGSCTI